MPESPLDEPLVGRGVEPGSKDRISVTLLPGEETASVLLWNPPGGVIGKPGQDRHVVVPRPEFGQLRDSRRGGADLRRKIMREKRYPHAVMPSTIVGSRRQRALPRARPISPELGHAFHRTSETSRMQQPDHERRRRRAYWCPVRQ